MAKSKVLPVNQYSKIGKVYAIMSGKGGVGKSLVTALTAISLSRKGYKVAILDADITGPTIPTIFGLKGRAMKGHGGMLPLVTPGGIEVMSMNLALEDSEDPVLWSGDIVSGAVKQFWTDVVWKDIDVMLVDMPPGTGDIPLTVCTFLPVDGCVMVTAPQELVKGIVAKALNMVKILKVPILGIVENMSHVKCPCCDETFEVFGRSKLESEAKKFSIPVLDRIALDPAIARMCDEGRLELCDDGIVYGTTNRMHKQMVPYSDKELGEIEYYSFVKDIRFKAQVLPTHRYINIVRIKESPSGSSYVPTITKGTQQLKEKAQSENAKAAKMPRVIKANPYAQNQQYSTLSQTYGYEEETYDNKSAVERAAEVKDISDFDLTKKAVENSINNEIKNEQKVSNTSVNEIKETQTTTEEKPKKMGFFERRAEKKRLKKLELEEKKKKEEQLQDKKTDKDKEREDLINETASLVQSLDDDIEENEEVLEEYVKPNASSNNAFSEQIPKKQASNFDEALNKQKASLTGVNSNISSSDEIKEQASIYVGAFAGYNTTINNAKIVEQNKAIAKKSISNPASSSNVSATASVANKKTATGFEAIRNAVKAASKQGFTSPVAKVDKVDAVSRDSAQFRKGVSSFSSSMSELASDIDESHLNNIQAESAQRRHAVIKTDVHEASWEEFE